jgi:hypothetical protein
VFRIKGTDLFLAPSWVENKSVPFWLPNGNSEAIIGVDGNVEPELKITKM